MKKVFVLFVIILPFLLFACNSKGFNNGNKIKGEKTQDTIFPIQSGKVIPVDTFGSSEQPLYVTLVGHGSIMFEYAGKIIHVDPYSAVVDYSKLPKADLVLLTHEHYDHLDTTALDLIRKDSTYYLVSKVCNEILGYGEVINNGDVIEWNGIEIKAVPAYNIVHKTPEGIPYHPKGRGNGYVVKFSNQIVYIAADTENIPEMEQLKGQIDIAFLPKNLPYTMDDKMFEDAAKKVMPKYLYPYHMSEFNEAEIGKALDGTGIQLKVRPMSNK